MLVRVCDIKFVIQLRWLMYDHPICWYTIAAFQEDNTCEAVDLSDLSKTVMFWEDEFSRNPRIAKRAMYKRLQ
jgi:hypothetical protein